MDVYNISACLLDASNFPQPWSPAATQLKKVKIIVGVGPTKIIVGVGPTAIAH